HTASLDASFPVTERTHAVLYFRSTHDTTAVRTPTSEVPTRSTNWSAVLPRALATCLLLVAAMGWVTAQSLTVMTHDSFSLPLALIEEFTAETGIEVEF